MVPLWTHTTFNHVVCIWNFTVWCTKFHFIVLPFILWFLITADRCLSALSGPWLRLLCPLSTVSGVRLWAGPNMCSWHGCLCLARMESLEAATAAELLPQSIHGCLSLTHVTVSNTVLAQFVLHLVDPVFNGLMSTRLGPGLSLIRARAYRWKFGLGKLFTHLINQIWKSNLWDLHCRDVHNSYYHHSKFEGPLCRISVGNCVNFGELWQSGH